MRLSGGAARAFLTTWGVVVLLVTGPSAFGQATGTAEQYGDDRSDECAQLSDTTLDQGDEFTVESSGAPCADDGEDVDVSLESHPVELGTMTADGDGQYSGTFRIPSGMETGSHSIVLRTTLNDDSVTYTRSITVSAADDDEDGGALLPRTGRDFALLVAWGIALVAMGTGLVTFARRIRRARRTRQSGGQPSERRRVSTPAGHK